jgi:signal-transduction protein with cAMP-binding, CBS, and nucleotidyltransferase domain
MKIKDRPEFKNKAPAFALRGDELASAAVKTMAEKNIGSVVVVDDDMKVRGIVTERDLVKKLLGGGLDPKSTPLTKIMTSNVRTANPEDRVIDWLRQMSNERFRHLPVVDENGRLINILSQGDFVSYTWPELLLSVREKTSETLRGPAAPLPILIGGIMLYTLLIIVVLRTF